MFEEHGIVRLFSKMFGSHSFPCQSLLLGTNVPNDSKTSVLVYYHSGVSSCYETLVLPGLTFVSGKLSLTTMLRLNVFQHWCNIILVCLVGMRH